MLKQQGANAPAISIADVASSALPAAATGSSVFSGEEMLECQLRCDTIACYEMSVYCFFQDGSASMDDS